MKPSIQIPAALVLMSLSSITMAHPGHETTNLSAAFHGIAHAAEMPLGAAALACALGFVAASIMLYLNGSQTVLRRHVTPRMFLVAGAIIASSGGVLLASV